eukprot:gene12094-25365_t
MDQKVNNVTDNDTVTTVSGKSRTHLKLIRFLLRMCPGAVTVKNCCMFSPLDEVAMSDGKNCDNM